MCKKKKEKKKDTVNTFTKIWVNRNMKFSWICIFLSFGLAYMGKTDIAETLACTIVVNIIGVFSGYFAKSFFETKEEKKNALKEKELELLHGAGVESNESPSEETEDLPYDPYYGPYIQEIEEDADI